MRNIRNRVSIGAVALATLLFAGCPYDGPPLGEPDPAVYEPGLAGAWNVAQSGDEDAELCRERGGDLRIMRFNAAEYLLAISIGESCEPHYARVYLSRLGDALFLNVQDVDLPPADAYADGMAYSLLRVDLTGDELRLRMVQDSLGEVTSSAVLRERLAPRVDDPSIYDAASEVTLRRVTPE